MNLAWHNDPDLKTATLADLRRDHEKDRLIRGSYANLGFDGDTYRGCQVGCLVMADMLRHGTLTDYTVHDVNWHAEVETRFGVPRALAYLWDRTFEGVPSDEATAFAVGSIEAVPVGADLSMVVSRVMLDVLADPDNGVWKFTKEGTSPRAAVERVAGLYVKRLAGEEPTRDEWMSARTAAAAAAAAADAAYAAYAAAYAAYAAAAAAAADAAAYAADAAAAAAYAADAYGGGGGARRGHFTWIGERIIHHTMNAPIPATTGSPE